MRVDLLPFSKDFRLLIAVRVFREDLGTGMFLGLLDLLLMLREMDEIVA